MRRLSIIIGISLLFLFGWFGFSQSFLSSDHMISLVEQKKAEPTTAFKEPSFASEASSVFEREEKPLPKTNIWSDVPFTSQAPTAEWKKSEFQNGCEEASTLIVSLWRRGKTLTREEVKQELEAMARFQERNIGQAVDTDVETTARTLLTHYFGITDYQIAYDFSLEEVRQATGEGLIIVPTNGRALKNPNYTSPGPLEHMLVVTGYDERTKEFITNDPGTRKGEGYRYPEEVLYDAIREYPTGNHLLITTVRKAMIIVPPASKS